MTDLSSLGPIGGPLGAPGGQGTVYELPDHPDLVLKRYHATTAVDPAGLDSLVAWRRHLTPADRAAVDATTAWPDDVVHCPDGTVAVVVRRAPNRFFHQVEGDLVPRDLSWAFCADAVRWAGLEPAPPTVCVSLVRRIAAVFEVFHRTGVCYGDVSATNILWVGGRRPEVFFLDCDSAHVTGQPRALADAQTPLWECPWPLEDRRRDEYKLALTFLRLFWRYDGPLTDLVRTVRLPAQPPVTRSTAALVEQGLREQGPRPAATDWLDPLQRLNQGLRRRRVA